MASMLPNEPINCGNAETQIRLIGYGDSSMNFQLRAWTDHLEDRSLISSDLACAIYKAVLQAGFRFPSPQREIRLLRDAEPDFVPLESGKVPGHKST
jgi:small-conductance mechanosensitive channel